MGYSLSLEEATKREKYAKKVYELRERFLKFGVEYLPGDRAEIYKPSIIFPEYTVNYKIHLYVNMGIMKARKVLKQMEDNIISRDQLRNYAMKNGGNFIDKMPHEKYGGKFPIAK